MRKKILTKSLYLAGLQCPKLLWIKSNDKKRLPELEEIAKIRFKKGYELEEIAKTMFKEGINVHSNSFMEGITKTKKGIEEKKILFEAAFLKDRLYARSDTLVPNDDGSWDLYEIKSGTKVKEVNMNDVAFQRHVLTISGLTIREIFIVHINNEYIFDGITIEAEKLFKKTNITQEVGKYSKDIDKKIESFLNILDNSEPVQDIGAHCNSPYECDMKYECWSHVPKDSVFNLHNANEKCFDLYAKGVIEFKDIPINYDLSQKQLIQKATHIEGNIHMNNKGIKEFMDKLEYPLYFLDFETTNPAIPKYKGMKPYQRIPFQYSLHIKESQESEPIHISFLHKSKEDPRKIFLEGLKKDLKEKGSIIIFNKSFEEGVLRESIEEYTEFSEWLEQVKKRFVDLIVPFRKFDYYNPKQAGSISIKNVVKAFSDSAYNNLDIQDGETANIKYEEAIYGDLSDKEKEEIFSDLKKYAKEDTLAEVTIINALQEIIKK